MPTVLPLPDGTRLFNLEHSGRNAEGLGVPAASRCQPNVNSLQQWFTGLDLPPQRQQKLHGSTVLPVLERVLEWQLMANLARETDSNLQQMALSNILSD